MLVRNRNIVGGLSLALGLIAAAALFLGWRSDLDSQVNWHITWQLQLPLVITAVLVGSVLAVSAGTLQVVLRNPLADPGIIGITSGASLVAALMLLLAPNGVQAYFYYFLPLGCFVGALATTLFIYRVARHLQGATVAVILAGIAVSTLSGAIVAWLYLFADAQAMRNLTFWLMGSLYQADWLILTVAGPVMLLSLAYQLGQASKLNLLYGGDIAAQAAGLDTTRLVNRSLLAAAVGVGAAVSVAGSVAFLGLLVPHLLRLTLGFDNRRVLPASALCGAIVLMLVVMMTEALQVVTLPVSMITATLGGPLLLLALYKGQWR